ncbi:MAG: hypothetical protein C5S48_02225 [Candidatus Methanogaster sp.]|nr:MAG: hypothetical protein C5S48_02225 [ANME-2 cluster archaeon]
MKPAYVLPSDLERIHILVGLFVTPIGSLLVWGGVSCFVNSGVGLFDRSIGLMFTLVGAISFLYGLHLLLIKESVIFDKRLQNITIEKDSFIEYFKSIEKIPFSHIKEIEITYHTSHKGYNYDSSANDSSGSWSISLITTDGGSAHIYDKREPKLEVGKIAGKICRITDTKVTHLTRYTAIPALF